MKSFFTLLSELSNPEKTRNFNVFKNYSLDHFQKALNEFSLIDNLNSKYKPFRFSVVGTNGKGSTSHYLSELLRNLSAENKVGLYTSPHFITPLERISLNGTHISETETNSLLSELPADCENILKELSYFELLTLVCFLFFRKNKCEYEVWEAGLGGRLDATKLISPDVVVLTKIGLDHCEILGNSLTGIALEKIAIASPRTKYIFSFRQTEEVEEVIRREGSRLGCKVIFQKEENKDNYLQSNFRFACEILSELGLSSESLTKLSFPLVKPPRGRMEILSSSPQIVFDPAHNPDAILHSLNHFQTQIAKGPFSLLLGCLPDKDSEGIANVLEGFSWENLILWEGSGFARWTHLPQRRNILRTDSESELFTQISGLSHPLFVLGSFRLYSLILHAMDKSNHL
ncbi:Mur ligase family protein [Leptospira idonii]|nr:Mur ligase family protein [Leptospira idonii]